MTPFLIHTGLIFLVTACYVIVIKQFTLWPCHVTVECRHSVAAAGRRWMWQQHAEHLSQHAVHLLSADTWQTWPKINITKEQSIYTTQFSYQNHLNTQRSLMQYAVWVHIFRFSRIKLLNTKETVVSSTNCQAMYQIMNWHQPLLSCLSHQYGNTIQQIRFHHQLVSVWLMRLRLH